MTPAPPSPDRGSDTPRSPGKRPSAALPHDPAGAAELRHVAELGRGTASSLRIALVQGSPLPSPEKACEEGHRYCVEAKAAGADLVVFPEMYNVGYGAGLDFSDASAVERWRDHAAEVEGAFVTSFRERAAESGLAMVMGFLERRGGELRNSAILIDGRGDAVLTYSKVHLLSFFPMEKMMVAGDRFETAAIETAAGTVRVGLMICYDREFPETARLLALRGAELILTPNACALNALRLGQFRARAWENAVAVGMANYAEGPGNGRSCAYQADGRELLVAGSEPGLILFDLDLGELRAIRRFTYWGSAHRRPHLYGGLAQK